MLRAILHLIRAYKLFYAPGVEEVCDSLAAHMHAVEQQASFLEGIGDRVNHLYELGTIDEDTARYILLDVDDELATFAGGEE